MVDTTGSQRVGPALTPFLLTARSAVRGSGVLCPQFQFFPPSGDSVRRSMISGAPAISWTRWDSSGISLFLQHQLQGNQIAYTAAQGSQEAWRGKEGEERGGEGSREKGEEKPPITFCDLTSKVMQAHVLFTLLVKAIIKVHPGSKGRLISQVRRA